MCSHVTIVPPLRALLESPDLRLDGFIGPGHVSTVVGGAAVRIIPADYGKPVVIAGFEPLDILQAILMILRQLAEGRCHVENQYKRVVPYEGNLRALEVWPRCSSCGRTSSGAGWASSPTAACDCPTPTPTWTPSGGSACPACESPTPRRANAARC